MRFFFNRNFHHANNDENPKCMATTLCMGTFAFTLLLSCFSGSAVAEEKSTYQDAHKGKSADQVAKELANPNNSFASLTFKNQYRWYTGDLPNADDQDNYTLLFQPVFPFTLQPAADGGKANLFIRPAVPLLVDQPVFNGDTLNFDEVSSLGDIGFDIGYGVTEKSGLLWAFGMVGTLPTATDSDVAGKQLRLGPEALFARFEKWGVYGIFPSHQWDVSGWDDDTDFSTSQLQPIFWFFLGDGWTIGTNPQIYYDWESEEWTVPLQLAVSKTTKVGEMPLKLELEVNYFVEQPDLFGPEWMVSFNITPVVANFIDRWVKEL